MEGKLIRTVIITSLVTALLVSAIIVYAVPRLSNRPDDSATTNPAVYDGPEQPAPYEPPPATTAPHTRRVLRPAPSATYPTPRDPYGEPVRRHHRSTEDSVLIVAGSSAAGAAIGGIAGGGKGAGIGAIAGGVAGLIYDRATANK